MNITENLLLMIISLIISSGNSFMEDMARKLHIHLTNLVMEWA